VRNDADIYSKILEDVTQIEENIQTVPDGDNGYYSGG